MYNYDENEKDEVSSDLLVNNTRNSTHPSGRQQDDLAPAFCVQRTTACRSLGDSVTYDSATLNHPSIDMDTGTFVAPRPGVYLFTLEFWCWRGTPECRAAVVVNGAAVRTARALAAGSGPQGASHEHVSTTTMARLDADDVVSVVLAKGWLYSDARDRWTQFCGSLLQHA